MRASNAAAPAPAEAYEHYVVPAMFEPFVADLLERAAPQPGARVLDLACGTGIVARRVAPLIMPGGSVDALDLNAAMLAVARDAARREGVACVFQQGDMAALPFSAGAYDLVTCQQGLQFVPERAVALREMRRVLRAGGCAVVSCWSAIEHHPLSCAIAGLLERHTGQPHMDAPFSLSDAEELRRLFETAGFVDITIDAVTRAVRFPDPRRYVTQSVSGVIAANPALQQLPANERGQLLAALCVEMEPLLQAFIVEDEVISTKQTLLLRAEA
jgi:SAM-dependent methyltransferase